MLPQSHVVGSVRTQSPRYEVLVDPETRGRHFFARDGNATCYQYCYDSRHDPRSRTAAVDEPHLRVERVVYANSQVPMVQGEGPRHKHRHHRDAVVIEELTDDAPAATISRESGARHQYQPTHIDRDAREKMPVVEEPDDESEDVNDDFSEIDLRPHSPVVSRRQPQPRQSSFSPHKGGVGMGMMMSAPFLEMERMHQQMMRSLGMSDTVFGRQVPTLLTGAGQGRLFDDVMPFGFGSRDPFDDLFFGHTRMGMGFH